MFEKLPNNKTSKNALYFLTLIVLTFLLLFGVFCGETYAIEQLVVKPQISQPQAIYDTSDVEVQIRNLANQENFAWTDYLVRLANCESTLNIYAKNEIGNSAGIDRGLYQWNSYYHPEISDNCAYDLECSTLETMKAINNGNQSWWVCNDLI